MGTWRSLQALLGSLKVPGSIEIVKGEQVGIKRLQITSHNPAYAYLGEKASDLQTIGFKAA